MQNRIPAVLMRGGTSRGLFFHADHLPKDPKIRDAVILAAYGSPDPNKRQIDGIGGAVSTVPQIHQSMMLFTILARWPLIDQMSNLKATAETSLRP